ncbi:ABC transporter substrate-binding protein [Neoactinobaculum massilliense]|uniref:ABC transporter substrate-binding protein n=1 Tax=Neoactinobaculum massilliense TaxID=2364794 RepID=UPI000F529C8E|nr:extracellular solute-binding protein [Neoactinobaculum massilliense]
MTTHKKRLMGAGAMLAAAAFALAGCSSGGSSKEATGAAEATTSDGQVVELTYMHRLQDAEGMTKVADIVSRWNKEHPNIQVKTVKFDGAAQDMIQKLETDVKAGNAACLAQVGYAEVPEVYTKGLLEDVTQYAEKYKDNFSEGEYNLMGVDGKIFGLPQDTGPLVYFYDTEAFKQLGIEVPTNAEELEAAAKKAAAQGKYILSFQADEAGNALTAQAAAAGDSWFTLDGDAWKVNTTGTGSTAVADVWQNLLDNKAVFTKPRWDASWSAAVADGSLIGTIGAAWEAPLIAGDGANSADAGKWAVAELPNWFGNADGATGPDGGSGVAVMKGCQYPAEAMEFNNWFNTQVDDLATQGLVTAASTSVPATPDSYGPFFAAGEDPMTVFSKASANMSSKFIFMPGWSSVTPVMTDKANAAIDGSAKVADVFSSAGDQAKTTLKDLGLQVAN